MIVVWYWRVRWGGGAGVGPSSASPLFQVKEDVPASFGGRVGACRIEGASTFRVDAPMSEQHLNVER